MTAQDRQAEPSREAVPPAAEPWPLATAAGPVVLRPERTGDAPFLLALFRSHVLPTLAMIPVDDATREGLLLMQFNGQTAGYRAQYPGARFDIVEREGEPVGRLILEPGTETAWIVDFALLPDRRGKGLGTAVLAAVLAGCARPVGCSVMSHNDPSLAMCRRVGFVPVAEEPPFLRLEWRPHPEAFGHAPSG